MIRRTAFLIGLAIAGATGCSDSKKPAGAEAASKPAAVVAAARPDAGTVAVITPYIYSYNPLGKRDPFRSMVDDSRVATTTDSPCKEPLCQWDLDQYTLVGVVSGDANPVAMVEDPMGRGYVIRRNTRIGKQGGKVTQILRDAVTVSEHWTAPDGKDHVNPINLHLKPDKSFAPVVDLSSGKQY
jgi:type IV pilus assembly protein PilP